MHAPCLFLLMMILATMQGCHQSSSFWDWILPFASVPKTESTPTSEERVSTALPLSTTLEVASPADASPLQKTIQSKSQHMKRDEAIAVYRSKVEQTNTNYDRCAQHRQQDPSLISMKYAVQCLQKTKRPKNTSLRLQYPMSDAEAHFNEIRWKMAPWAQHAMHSYHTANGYAGPWMENQWISHFESLHDDNANTTCLYHHFGPYIPIFLPWVDHLVTTKYMYPDGFLEALASVLRPDVPYVTVSQNARGLKGKGGEGPNAGLLDLKRSLPNLLVLSAGGYGHVPIPLLMQDEPRNNALDVSQRRVHLSYVGSLKNAPHGAREMLHEELSRRYGNASRPTKSFRYDYYYGAEWRSVMAQSKFSLVPRGFGRTAYHLMETLQMGLVPVYVHLPNDISWIPYAPRFAEIGYSTDFNQVVTLIETTLRNVSDEEIRVKEQRILSLRDSHFSTAGILQQIQKFLMAPSKSDLQCQALPRTVTGIPKYG
jgi:hypothetical protein